MNDFIFLLKNHFNLIFILFLCLIIIALIFYFKFKKQKYYYQKELINSRHLSEIEAYYLKIEELNIDNEELINQIEQIQLHKDELIKEVNILSNQLASKTTEVLQVPILQTEKINLQNNLQQTSNELTQAKINLEKLTLQNKKDSQSFEEKIALLLDTKEQLKLEFSSLANTILDEKSKKFTEQNQTNISQLVNPIKEKIKDFSQLIQNTYEKETQERSSLKQELKQLHQLNSQLHTQANALTNALTGKNNKTQGNWGEMILEKILENSGLRKNIEYQLQKSFNSVDNDENTSRKQPDVIINLPEQKHIIIDAKVSLNAYVNYINTQNEDEKKLYVKGLLESVKTHIKTLAKKEYHNLPQGHSLDFILMFIPVEPAYLTVLQQDDNILQFSFEKQIMLVGPSTLLAMLKTVANIWRFENQTQNTLNIAKEGGRLYDKFVSFLEKFEDIGKSLDRAQKNYQEATKNLTIGRGNLVTRIENLKQMGAQTNKKINQKFFESDTEYLKLKFSAHDDLANDDLTNELAHGDNLTEFTLTEDASPSQDANIGKTIKHDKNEIES